MICSSFRRLIHKLHNLSHEVYIVRTAYVRGLEDGILPNETLEKHRSSVLNEKRDTFKPQHSKQSPQSLDEYLSKHPEFLPSPRWEHRDRISETLERRDMLRRRKHIHIPEFYVGSIVAVTVADKHSAGKTSRFLGICIEKEGHGLRHKFTLRNVLDDQGIEIMYEMYSPMIQKIEVIKLEKRLDDRLVYLRDCPLEYSTFPQDMEPEIRLEDEAVPVNSIKVPLGPRPWEERWERANLLGIQDYTHLFRSQKALEKNMRNMRKPEIRKPWEEFDIIKHYRETADYDTKVEVTKEVERDRKNWKSKQDDS